MYHEPAWSRRAEPQLAFSLFFIPLQTYLRHLSKHLRTRLFTSIGKAGDPELGWDCQQLFFPRVCRVKNRRAKCVPGCALLVEGRWEGRKEYPCSASGGVCAGRAPSRSAVGKCCPASAGEALPVDRAVLSLQGVLQKRNKVIPTPPTLNPVNQE